MSQKTKFSTLQDIYLYDKYSNVIKPMYKWAFIESFYRFLGEIQ
jgi:hypothetical protein